ncbi:DNA ligase D [Dyadobacter psychrotolerans]|uniref:DNA ligase (ATP) n=1 Tax=Dyadobacter psychrotolerans TaxID=2541721 RepID=A0A4R5DP41_9BACT|nr:DNA ligase D [Dyadobacter psychrotolerans]TDE13900.1 DNA ligase D [Dyadobacter psychrotolerans]
MSLVQYKKKRSFDDTPEPTAGKPADSQLRFVIQKHHASRLHYDFRLEMDGVLKSWAVPKGPSTDPSVKRLAMMVEDHPFDYKDFEGSIPKGNYGAGTVIVWDEGTYEPIEKADNKKAREKLLLKQLKEGSLKFVLKGKKLNGEFALVRTKGMEDNAWLLIKHKDKHASDSDITKKDKSVKSNKTLEDVKANPEDVYGRNIIQPGSTLKDKPANTKDEAKQKISEQIENDENSEIPEPAKKDVKSILKNAPEKAFDLETTPMLATLVDAPFDEEGWEYEVKWDGYRALAITDKNNAQLKSRNNKSFNDKFYPVYEAIQKWKVNAVVDGEIVVVNEKGISDFGSLQNWRSEADGELLFYVFDILWLDGKDLTGLPLYERKAVLQSTMPEEGLIRSGYSVETDGTAFFDAARELGLEGIIAKRSDSLYLPGARTKDWLKIKINKRQEVVIAGYTRNEGSSKHFSSLLLGVYENGDFVYVGKVGTGFKDKQQKEMLEMFKPLVTEKSPFNETPDYNKPSRFRPNPPKAKATWLKPSIVCEVSFAEITSDGVFRHPSFEGLREDKKAKDVIRETEADVEEVLDKDEKKAKHPIIKPPKEKTRQTLLNPTEQTQVRKIDGNELKFSNLSKVFWPKEKITKRDLINYYYQVAPFILPYLLNRPMSLNRFPNGIQGKSFYQKDVTGKAPSWIELFPYSSNDKEQNKNYMVCKDEASLLYMVNQGCIDINPWNSRVEAEDNPDWCILDLDPDTTNTFEQVILTAQTIKQILDDSNIPGYCKTSGSTGIHIYIPLGAKYSYDQCQLFAKWIAIQAQEQLPEFTSIERMTKNRKDELYIDYLQNRPKATLAAPYSVRPKPGATVSMPLHWDEVQKGLQLKDFTISNALERLQKEGDIFKPVLGEGINLAKILGDMAG